MNKVHDGCRECCLTFRRADRVEAFTAPVQRKPGQLVSYFVTANETWLHRFNPESKVQSKARKHGFRHLPESFTLLRRLAKLRQLYYGMLRDLRYRWFGTSLLHRFQSNFAIQGQEVPFVVGHNRPTCPVHSSVYSPACLSSGTALRYLLNDHLKVSDRRSCDNRKQY